MLCLLITSDAALAERVGRLLQWEAIETSVASSGAAALELVGERRAAPGRHQYGLFLIDSRLGHSIAVDLAAASPGVPVVQVDGQEAEAEHLLEAVYRSLARPRPELFSVTVGPWRLDFRADRLWLDGERIHLSASEVRILELLARRRGDVLSREDILAHIYPGQDEMSPKILDVFVTRIRRILRHHMLGHLLVRTVWAKGYTFGEWEPEAGI